MAVGDVLVIILVILIGAEVADNLGLKWKDRVRYWLALYRWNYKVEDV